MPKGVYPHTHIKPKVYPPEMVARVRDLYVKGHTIQEIATHLSTSYRVIWRLMENHGIERRVAAKRDQRGTKNSAWREGEVTYSAYHYRVIAARGSPQKCDRCGTTDPAVQYDWANLTGDYADPNDYERMCRGCHWVYDKKHLNFKGATGGRPARKEGA